MITNGKIQLYPMLRIALFLVVGIFLGHGMAGVVAPSAWLAGLVLSVVLSFLLFRFPILQTVCLLFSVTLLGAFLVCRQDVRLSLYPDDKEYVHRAVLLGQPIERGKIVRCDLRLVEGCYAGHLVKASILRDTVAHRYKSLNVGDGIVISSVLECPRQFRKSNFNYPLYLRCHGFSATTFVYWNAWKKETVSLRSMSMVERTRLRALMFRQRLLSSLDRLNIDAESMAVLSAMALGEKSGLSNEIREVYSLTGVSHVLALSGMHLGMIYGFLLLIFRFRRFRILQEVLMLLLIWTFVFVVGLSPSVVRAATMLTLYSIIGLFNRDKFSLNTLGLTVVIMLLVNPLSLFDVGFELSFVAVFFILLLYRPVYSLLPSSFLARNRIVRWVWGVVVISCVAQLGISPLVAYYFGRLPVYFLLTNLIIMSVIPFVLYAFFVMVVMSFVPAFQQLIATVLSFVMTQLNAFFRWIASLPGAQLGEVHINLVQVVLLYFLIAGCCYVIWKLRKPSMYRV